MSAPIRSSLPLQVLLFFNGWFDALLVLVSLAMYIWKASVLPFPPELEGFLARDVALVFGLVLLEYSRLFLGSRGNKTERIAPLLWFLLLSLPALAVNIYFMLLQLYVTRLDLILNATALGFVCAEILLALLTIITFLTAPAGVGQ
ncbi:hypothetical protein AB1Y20_013334 [Prymnesium parvum]|uniref:Transmembrane protein 216 n=1 Tax=Prymnesium parvum TaxID=97485 RepID=A0AB34IN75_PRYPA